MSGRRAALPDAGYEPPRRLFVDDAACRVRFISPNGASARDFDFTGLPVSAALRTAFAVAFDKHVGPSGTVHTADGARATSSAACAGSASCSPGWRHHRPTRLGCGPGTWTSMRWEPAR